MLIFDDELLADASVVLEGAWLFLLRNREKLVKTTGSERLAEIMIHNRLTCDQTTQLADNDAEPSIAIVDDGIFDETYNSLEYVNSALCDFHRDLEARGEQVPKTLPGHIVLTGYVLGRFNSAAGGFAEEN